MHKIFNIGRLIILATFLQSCGVAISSHHDSSFDDFVSYTISEIKPNGRIQYLYSDCINMDDPFEYSGSVHIDTPYVGEDLYMNWENSRNDLVISFENDFRLVHSTSFSTYYFRSGNEAEFSIGTDFTDYLIQFSGPYCNN